MKVDSYKVIRLADAFARCMTGDLAVPEEITSLLADGGPVEFDSPTPEKVKAFSDKAFHSFMTTMAALFVDEQGYNYYITDLKNRLGHYWGDKNDG